MTRLRRPVLLCVVWALVVTTAACGARGDLAAMSVKGARLEKLKLQTLAAVMGIVTGDADLVVTDTRDREHTFRTTLGGPTFGVLLDVSSDEQDMFDLDNDIELDIAGAGAEPSGAVLLGVYGGERAGVHFAIGITKHTLENQSGVKLDASLLGFGIGGFAGPEWITLDLDEDSSEADADAGR